MLVKILFCAYGLGVVTKWCVFATKSRSKDHITLRDFGLARTEKGSSQILYACFVEFVSSGLSRIINLCD